MGRGVARLSATGATGGAGEDGQATRVEHSLSAALASAAIAALAATAALLVSHPPAPPPGGDDARVAAERDYASLPLAFEQNRGQAPGGVDYLARSEAGTAYLSEAGATIALQGKHRSEAIELRLRGSSPASAEPVARLPGEVNHLIGDDLSKWRTGLSTFERVRYPGVYPGVDLLWHGDQRALEYDFRLAPHADPDAIALEARGAEALRIAANGDLMIDAGRGTVRQRAPVAYQEVGGERRVVEVAYRIDAGRIAFELGRYDRSRALVIDPVVLAYSTYLGGSSDDAANEIAVDSAGAAYVAGQTISTDFNTVGQIEGDEPFNDAFVAKLTPDGSALAYSTYLGGNNTDSALGIAVDSSGAAYVAGETGSTDFNTVGQIEGDETASDAFVAKLTPAGSALAYSTYLGGDGADTARGIAVDSSGAAYVAGETGSTDFNGVGQIEGDEPFTDAFVSKLNPAGSALVYSTYLGGNLSDVATAIAVDSAGAAYVGGFTTSIDFNTVGQIEGDGGDSSSDAFVSKLNPTGSALAYSTYLGGNGFDIASAIAVDSSGAAYVAGETGSTDFNTVGQIEGDGGDVASDAFVSKLTPAGSALTYSTYLGGNESDSANAIAVDSTGAAHVAGHTSSTNFNIVGEIEGDGGDSNFDAFVSKLTPAGSALDYSTYLGGNNNDSARGIAVDSTGVAYVAGETFSTDFNTVGEIEGDDAGPDAFVAKLVGPADLALSKSDSPDPATAGELLTYTLVVTNNGPEVALNAKVVDTLPDGVDFVSAPAGCRHATGVVICELGSIALTQSKTVQIVVRPFAAVTITNQATASATNFDPNPPNNSASEETTVLAAPPEPDTDPPETTITAGPTGTTNDETPVFEFSADEAASFECRLDSDRERDFLPCSSPHAAGLVADGPHAFEVRAIDAAGNVDATPAVREFAVATTGCRGQTATIVGTEGPDRIAGTSGDDVIVTFAGDDRVNGAGGNDRICSGGDDDIVSGGLGADQIVAGSGDDVIGGDDGSDFVFGGGGEDTVNGGNGDDDVRGGAGDDTATGGLDADTLRGGSDDDSLNGADGFDSLTGGSGEDNLSGDAGDDVLRGNSADDTLGGGIGADDMFGNSGDDTARGSTGADQLIGGSGDDDLQGENDADDLRGGGDDDDLDGGAGADACAGGSGENSFTSCE